MFKWIKCLTNVWMFMNSFNTEVDSIFSYRTDRFWVESTWISQCLSNPSLPLTDRSETFPSQGINNSEAYSPWIELQMIMVVWNPFKSSISWLTGSLADGFKWLMFLRWFAPLLSAPRGRWKADARIVSWTAARGKLGETTKGLGPSPC